MARPIALVALLLPGCFDYPDAPSCTEIPLPDPVEVVCTDDTDGDGIVDCDDPDIDEDGLRNAWDCSPYDEEKFDIFAGGRCDDPLDRDDGDLTVARGETFSLDVEHTTLSLDARAGSATLSVRDGSDFSEGDEILIVSQQGDGAGTYEFINVASADKSSITVEPKLINDYDSADLVRIQRVPHYDSVTINGTVVASAWDSSDGGGILMFRSCGTVDVSGTLDMSGLGFVGGTGVVGNDYLPTTGESYVGPPLECSEDESETETYSVGARNGGGGAAPYVSGEELKDQQAGGGGGAYATAGQDSENTDNERYAQGGDVYGDRELLVWFMGSGGGAGAPEPEEKDGDDLDNISGDGGAGGGIITVFAKDSLLVSGTISSTGAEGGNAISDDSPPSGATGGEVGGGGGGAGGQVMLVSKTIEGDGTISLEGGKGGRPGANGVTETRADADTLPGDGGFGFLRLDGETVETTGTVTVGTTGPFEGDYTQWCWESEPLPTRPCEDDADGDGVLAWECGGTDCDDADGAVFPGADDLTADGIDQNCDGLDACDDAVWLQGGMKPGGCSTGGSPSSLLGLLGAGLALLSVRRR